MPLDLIAGISVGVFAAFIFAVALGAQLGKVLGFSGAEDLTAGQGSHIPLTAIMVAIIYGFSVAAAIYPKTASKSLDRHQTAGRKWLAYVLSGVLAVCLASITVLTFRFLLFFDFAKAVQSVYWSAPWFWMSFFTGACTSFLVDDFAQSRAVPKWGRLAEGATLAVILMVVAMVLVFPALEFRASLEANPQLIPKWVGEAVPSWFLKPPIWAVLPTAGAIGFLIGFFVPHEYRLRPAGVASAEAGDEEPDGDLVHQAH